MMRTTDGKLAILDFGLMTEVTQNQKYGMVEAIAVRKSDLLALSDST
jgi:aarF domain-containing kinase